MILGIGSRRLTVSVREVLDEEAHDVSEVRRERRQIAVRAPRHDDEAAAGVEIRELTGVGDRDDLVFVAMHEHDRSAHLGDAITGSDRFEASPDQHLDAAKDPPGDRCGEGEIGLHHLAGMGEAGDRDHRIEIIDARSVIDRSAGPHRVPDHPDGRDVMSIVQVVDGYREILREPGHGRIGVVIAEAVISSVEEERVETGFVQRRGHFEHVSGVPAPTVQHHHRRCGALDWDEPAVEPDPVGAIEPDLVLGEIEVQWGLMDVTPRRPKRPLERGRGGGSDAGPDRQRDEQRSFHDRAMVRAEEPTRIVSASVNDMMKGHADRIRQGDNDMKKWLWMLILLIIAAGVGAAIYQKRQEAAQGAADTIGEAVTSASASVQSSIEENTEAVEGAVEQVEEAVDKAQSS